MAVGTIIAVVSVITAVAQAIKAAAEAITSIKQMITALRETDMQNAWKSTTNADSNIFNQRMQELDEDIMKLLTILGEYVEALNRSAAEYEATQQATMEKAAQLKRPTG